MTTIMVPSVIAAVMKGMMPSTMILSITAASCWTRYRASAGQIGRASCRGRGEISGGAVLFKKKKNRVCDGGIGKKKRMKHHRIPNRSKLRRRLRRGAENDSGGECRCRTCWHCRRAACSDVLVL